MGSSAGAAEVSLYALNSAEQIPTVLGQLKYEESEKIGGKILGIGEKFENRDASYERKSAT